TEVMLRERLGESLPEGVALGPGGEPTRDPTAARRGALLPFGGHKGFGLALMMQALGLLAGSGSVPASDYGYLFIAFRPDPFGPADAFERQVTQLIERIRRRHGSPASTTSAFRPSGHFALASAHSARVWRSTGWYSMRSSHCARGKERRSGVSSDLWFPKIPSSRIARPNRTSRPRARVPGTALRGLLRSHLEHCRAHGLARLQVAMRLCGVFQRIGLLDLDLDRAREHHSEEILCHRREIGTGGSVGV